MGCCSDNKSPCVVDTQPIGQPVGQPVVETVRQLVGLFGGGLPLPISNPLPNGVGVNNVSSVGIGVGISVGVGAGAGVGASTSSGESVVNGLGVGDIAQLVGAGLGTGVSPVSELNDIHNADGLINKGSIIGEVVEETVKPDKLIQINGSWVFESQAEKYGLINTIKGGVKGGTKTGVGVIIKGII